MPQLLLMDNCHINNAASRCVSKCSSWRPKTGNLTCSLMFLVPVTLAQTWAPAASSVLWLWSWNLLYARASCQKPALPRSAAGAAKSAREGLGADGQPKLNPEQINKSIGRFDHSIPCATPNKALVFYLFINEINLQATRLLRATTALLGPRSPTSLFHGVTPAHV